MATYITNLQSDSLSNQNISSALLLSTLTNTTRARVVLATVFADQIAGNGSYVVYATRQRSGAGSAYEVGARTTVAVPSGITAQAFPSIQLSVGATDVVKVYLVGLAGDTTTPDTIVDWDEINAAQTGDAMALTSGERNSTADALLDRANAIDTSITLRQALRVVLAATGGKVSGAATTTITFRDTADSKNRIVATVDADGNRSAVTLDVS